MLPKKNVKAKQTKKAKKETVNAEVSPMTDPPIDATGNSSTQPAIPTTSLEEVEPSAAVVPPTVSTPSASQPSVVTPVTPPLQASTPEIPTVELPEQKAPDPVVTPDDPAVPVETAEEDVFAEEPKGTGKKIFMMFLIALIIGAISVSAYFFIQAQNPKSTTTTPPEVPASPQEETPAEEEPAATDEAALEETEEQTETSQISALTVEILNGSGIAGQAGAVEELLADTGLENFDTGNADSFDFEETTVQMKEAVPASVFKSITDALSIYTVVEGDALDPDADYDIIITVGQKSS